MTLQKTAVVENLDGQTQGTAKKYDAAYYIKSIIGLAIMIFFGNIPAPAPITHVGMVVLGQFIGLIFLWTFVDMVWPTFAAIVLFGFIATQVYPNSFAMAGIYEAGMQSIGNWCVVIMIGLLIICEVLSETGLIKRIALWFLTRKFAKKSPWSFTFMFFLTTFILGMFLDVSAAQVFMLALAKEIFDMLGLSQRDKWTRVITIGATFSVVIAFGATPICHTMPILFMGIYSGIAGVGINWLSYMLTAIPVGIILFFLMFAFFRFVVKPDMSKLESADFGKLDVMRKDAGRMTSRDKIVTVVCLIVVFCWVLPGFLSFLAPNAAITTWFSSITMLTPLFVAIVVLAIVKVGGRPILDIPKATSKISFLAVFLLAGIMLIATAMGEATTGISAWVLEFITPLTAGMSPFVLVAFIAVVSVILTNVANNVPVGIVLVSVGVPVALQMGIDPFVVAVTVSMAGNLAYCIPPAFVPVGYCYADPFGGGKYTLRWGVVMTLISAVVCGLLMYPLGVLFG
jgi:sodium-dependent dicarboxylate transporter 2/3/5